MQVPVTIRNLFAGLLFLATTIAATAQSYTWTNVRIGGGGDVTSIVADTAVPNLFFATTNVGNCYRWNSTTGAWEGLMNWVPASQWNNATCENIAFDPNDSTGNILYATVGLYGTQTYSWAPEGKVIKSTDGGNTWTDAGLPLEISSNGSNAGCGECLGVDPQNSSVVYVTSNVNGTYRGTNGGTTWSQISTINGTFLAFDVSGGTVNGMTKNIFLGTKAGVYLSTDGGNTFALSTSSTVDAVGAASINKDGTLYVATSTGVLKWTKSSGAWVTVTPASGSYGAVAADPNNSNNVIASINSWSSPTYLSNNGGTSWTLMSNNTYSVATAAWLASQGTGWDAKQINSFAWDPFNTGAVWITDIFSIWQTTNVWASTVAWTAQDLGEEETVADGTLLAPPAGSPNVLLSDLADVGGFDHTSITSSPATPMAAQFPWTASLNASGSMTGVAVEQTNPNFIVRVGRAGWNGPSYAGYSTNAGKTYTIFSNDPGAGGRVAVSANSQTIIWATQGGYTYRSTNLGGTWTQVVGLPSGLFSGTSIFDGGYGNPIVADKVNGNKFYAYNAGNFYVSTDGGQTFAVTATLPNVASQTSLNVVTSPGIEGDVWMSLPGAGLYHSTDSGATFTQINNVQNPTLMAVGAAATTTPAVYVMGEVNSITDGVFRSDDAGNTWTEIDTPEYKMGDQPSVMAADLNTYGRVFIGTGGDGIYVGTDTGSGGGTTVPAAPTGLTATSSTTALQINLSWTASATSGVTYNVYRSTTSGFTPSSSNQIASGLYSTSYADTTASQSTTYYYVVVASNAAGSSPASSQASATTITLAVPVAPTGLTATSSTTAVQINLSWTASTTTGVTYNVYRSTTSGFTPSSSNQIASGVTGTAYSDTAVTASTTYYYVVVASSTTAGSSPASAQASATTIAGLGSGGVIAIDAGGPAAGNYAADEYVSGGSISTPSSATINTVGVADPAPQEVYQTQRWGAMTYTIPNLIAGTQYTVTLQFNDTYWTKAGQREFNVLLNGTQVLTNFDIIAATGGQNIAIAKSFTAIANSSGQIVIQFTVGAVDQPTIGGIEVSYSGIVSGTLYDIINKNSSLCINDTASTDGAAVDQTACVSGQNSQAWVFTPTSNGYYYLASPITSNEYVLEVGGGNSATAPGSLIDTYWHYSGTGQQWMPVPLGNGYYKFVVLNSGLCLDVPSASTASGVRLDIATCNGSAEQAWQVVVPPVVAIDAGGPAVGNYAADEYVSGGTPAVSTTNTVNTTLTMNPAPQGVYQTERYGAMTYTVPGLTAGAPYTVTLRFADEYATAAGQRLFNVLLNGTQVLTNYDIFVDAGGTNIATDRSFTATANSSGQIVIQFTAVTGNPIVSAITVQ